MDGPSGETQADRNARRQVAAAERAHRLFMRNWRPEQLEPRRSQRRPRARAPTQRVHYTGTIRGHFRVRRANGTEFTIHSDLPFSGSVTSGDMQSMRNRIVTTARARLRARARNINESSPINGQVVHIGGEGGDRLEVVVDIFGGVPVELNDIAMHEARVMWADAFVRWASPSMRETTGITLSGESTLRGGPVSRGNCVVTTLRAVYKLSERSVMNAIFDQKRRTSRVPGQGLYYYEWEGEEYDPLAQGVTTRMVARFAEYYRIPMIAVGLDGESFYTYTPPIPRKGNSMRVLFFAVSNGHMYFLDHKTKGLIRSYTSNRKVYLFEYKSTKEGKEETREGNQFRHILYDEPKSVTDKILALSETTEPVTLLVSECEDLSPVLEDIVTRKGFIPSRITAYDHQVGGFSVKSRGAKVSVRMVKDYPLAKQLPPLRPLPGLTPPSRFAEFEGCVPALYDGQSLAETGTRILDRSVALYGIKAYASAVSEEAWDRVFDKRFMPRAAYGLNPRYQNQRDVKSEFAVDICKCYASILADFGDGGIPVYSAFDKVERVYTCVMCGDDEGVSHGFWHGEDVTGVREYEDMCCSGRFDLGWSGSRFLGNRPGFWKVRSDPGAGFPFPAEGGVGWYATPVVAMAINEGLVTETQIEERYLSSFRLPGDIFKKGIEFILTQFAGLPDAAKGMIMAYGRFGTRDGKKSKVYVTCDPIEAGAILAKNPKAVAFPMNVCADPDSFDATNAYGDVGEEEWKRVSFDMAVSIGKGEGDSDDDDHGPTMEHVFKETKDSYRVFQIRVPTETVFFRTKYPLYCYIVQMGWLKLRDMIRHYESRYPVRWVAVKVDCAAFSYLTSEGDDDMEAPPADEKSHDPSLSLYENTGRYKPCDIPVVSEGTLLTRESPDVEGTPAGLTFSEFRNQFVWQDTEEERVFGELYESRSYWTGRDVTTHVDWSSRFEGWVETLLDLFVEGRGALVLGGAGTGKTTLTNALLDKLYEKHPTFRFIKVAPTNKAALHIGGGTIDKVFGQPDTVLPDGVTYQERIRQFLRPYPEDQTVLVVDEVSMCREDHYNTFMLVRALRPDIKFLMVGDFDQCPPVEPVMHEGPRGVYMGEFASIRHREGALFDYKNSDVLYHLVGGHRILLSYSKRFDEALFSFVNDPSMSRNEEVRRASFSMVSFTPTSATTRFRGLRWEQFTDVVADHDICWTNAVRKFSNWWSNGAKITEALTRDATYRVISLPEDPLDSFTQSMSLGEGTPMIALKAWQLHGVVKNTMWTVTSVEPRENVLNSLVRMRPVDASSDLTTGQNQQDGDGEVEVGPQDVNSCRLEIEITAAEARSYFILAYCLTAHRLQGDTLRHARVGIWEAGELARLGKFRVLYTMLTRVTALDHLVFYDHKSDAFRDLVSVYLAENPGTVDPFQRGFIDSVGRGAGLGDEEEAMATQQGVHELFAHDELIDSDEDFDDVE